MLFFSFKFLLDEADFDERGGKFAKKTKAINRKEQKPVHVFSFFFRYLFALLFLIVAGVVSHIVNTTLFPS